MIEYEEEWIIKLLFQIRGSTGIRATYFAVPAAILAALLPLLEEKVDTGLDEISGSPTWVVVTGVLMLLLGFRTRQALSRFWEGTGLLHQMRGEWFDSVSCCVTFSRSAAAGRPAAVSDFRHTIVRLMSLCHGSALEEIADAESGKIPTIDVLGLDLVTLRHLKECKEIHEFNRVEVILHLIQTLITKALDDDVLKIPPPILSRVYQTLSRGFVNLLNAKKITDTRFPFPYAQLIAMLLLLQMVLTPALISQLINHQAWAMVFTFVPIFGMFSLNFTASELENPFGSDDNDLPLAKFQDEMNTSLMMLLHGNTDHIAGISARCVTDFEQLAEEMRPETRGRGSKLRASISALCDEQLASSGGTNSVGAASSMDSSQSRVSFQSAAPVPAELAGQARPSVPRSSLHPSPGAAAANAEASANGQPVAPAAGRARGAPSPQDLRAAAVGRGMDDFNAALQVWTQLVECQIGDLSRSFSALGAFSGAAAEAAQRADLEDAAGDLREEAALMSLRSIPAV